MPFQALTDALILTEGVTLNIMAVPQTIGAAPARIAVGARVTIRLGHCCPAIAEGMITARSADPERAVLTLAGADWILAPEPGGAGVSIPGIVSEDWVVC